MTAIMILNYNGAAHTLKCLESVLVDSEVDPAALVVIDNGSTDESVREIRSAYPEVRVIENGGNLGYAGGFNRVIEMFLKSGTEEFFLLNNDTIVRIGSLRTLLSTLRSDPQIGVVGPALLDMGTNRIQTLGALVDWRRGGGSGRFTGLEYDSKSHGIDDVEFVVGCALLVKREVFERIGLFDTNLFMYGEDLDLCLRASKSGFRVVCDAAATVEHEGEGTISRYPETKARFLTRSRIIVTKRYGMIRHFMSVVLLIFAIEVPYYSLLSFLGNKKMRAAVAHSRGALEGLAVSIHEPRFKSENGDEGTL